MTLNETIRVMGSAAFTLASAVSFLSACSSLLDSDTRQTAFAFGVLTALIAVAAWP